MTSTSPRKLSVVIPAYNEESTIESVLREVRSVEIPGVALEIIVVDDGSTDRTQDVCRGAGELIDIYERQQNQGKGAALRRGFQLATGDFVIVQDADLEYDPHDYPRLLAPLLADKADVVIGTRFAASEPHLVFRYWHALGNRFLTHVSNAATGLYLTDMECCYKVFRREILQNFQLTENRFGFEPEVVAQVAKLGCRVFEVSVSYDARSYAEGKKIGAKDGFRALYVIAKHRIFR